MFELHIADSDFTNGSILVSWCIDQEMINLLSEWFIVEPSVVIITAPSGENFRFSKENRIVVPLKDLLAYITFTSSGKNKIWALVSRLPLREAKNKYLQRNGRHYSYDILSYDGVEQVTKDLASSIPLEVEVPEQYFAKPPAKWERAWVNLFFRNKPIDQCDFRKRRLFAYTIQPILILLSLIIRLLMTFFALSIGSRSLTLKYLLHPLTYDLEDTLELFKHGTIFINSNSKNTFLKYVKLIFMPWVMISLILMLKLSLSNPAYPIAGLVILFCIMIGILFGRWFDVASIFLSLKITEKLGLMDEPWYLNKNELELILCSGENKIHKLSDLPANHRTLRLKFYDLKRKVCRPFSL